MQFVKPSFYPPLYQHPRAVQPSTSVVELSRFYSIIFLGAFRRDDNGARSCPFPSALWNLLQQQRGENSEVAHCLWRCCKIFVGGFLLTVASHRLTCYVFNCSIPLLRPIHSSVYCFHIILRCMPTSIMQYLISYTLGSLICERRAVYRRM